MPTNRLHARAGEGTRHDGHRRPQSRLRHRLIQWRHDVIAVDLRGCGPRRAAAPIIANLPTDIAANCKPSRPVPVLVMNGTADPLVPYNGGGVGFAGRRGNVMSTDETMTRLRRINGCPDTGKTVRLPDLRPRRWFNCHKS